MAGFILRLRSTLKGMDIMPRRQVFNQSNEEFVKSASGDEVI